MTELLPDLAYLRTAIVNVYFVGRRGAGDRNWVLIDAGMPGYADTIARHAADRFGAGARPAAIVLTHGHFDHIGSLRPLLARWDVPVYAHRLEFPYLDGRSSYPPPDPAVGGGAMARLSILYPRGPIDVSDRLREVPADGTLPEMPAWRWLHTPGHTTGHVSLYRDADRTLLAGDAFTTTRQESLSAVASQRQEMHGPPAYYTSDWDAARDSVRHLAALRPELGATGHGVPMRGEELRTALDTMAERFDRLERPRYGRYVDEPAVADETGVRHVPPPAADPGMIVAGAAGAAVLGIAVGYALRRPGTDRRKPSRRRA